MRQQIANTIPSIASMSTTMTRGKIIDLNSLSGVPSDGTPPAHIYRIEVFTSQAKLIIVVATL